MCVQAIVHRKRKKRPGKGFTRTELKEAGLTFKQALHLRIPIDIRRSTQYDENVETLSNFLKTVLEPKVQMKQEVRRDLADVKGIGPKLSEKLVQTGITTANELATLTPKKLASALGSSEERALKLIDRAKSLLNEK